VLKDENICSEENNLEEILANINQKSKKFRTGTTKNDQGLCKYHRYRKPISRSDIIFERFEQVFSIQ
jgi:hypothetical protein